MGNLYKTSHSIVLKTLQPFLQNSFKKSQEVDLKVPHEVQIEARRTIDAALEDWFVIALQIGLFKAYFMGPTREVNLK